MSTSEEVPRDPATGAGVAQEGLRPRHVEPVTLGDLAARIVDAVPGTEVTATGRSTPEGPSTGATRVSGVSLRAHEVRRGDLFAALPGARAHGADFAELALDRGAVALLTDPEGAERAAVRDARVPVLVHEDPRAALGPAAARVYGDPATRLGLLGVTGTSGKTTTVYLLESALAAAGARTGLIGTVETRLRGRVVPSAFTTPEAPDLQALLAIMLEEGATHVAMEVSSHALALHRVGGTEFAVGAFTNLSQDHLDFHPDMEDYFAAKALLFDGRAADEVVCVDSGWGRRLVRETTRSAEHADRGARSDDADTTATATATATVSADPAADATWRPADLVEHPDGTQTFTAHGPGGIALPVTLELPGAFNVANALVALACGHATGLDPHALAQGLGRVSVPGRMQRVDAGQPYLAVVDYAHKPAAVSALLEALRARVHRGHGSGRVLTVLGSGGDRDRAKRPRMGRIAAELSDRLWVTDDNPRTEDPAAIRAAMIEGTLDVTGAAVTEIGDRRDAIAAAVAEARPGDVVVVAGKGHETGQQVGAEKLPFSDVEELRHAIVEAGR